MSAKHRNKGAEGERELARILSDHDGTLTVSRELESVREGGPDILYRDYAIECKRQRKLSLTSWYTQAVDNAGPQPAAVAFRLDREQWRVMPVMSIKEFVVWAKLREHVWDD